MKAVPHATKRLRKERVGMSVHSSRGINCHPRRRVENAVVMARPAGKSTGGRAPSPSVEETPIYISRCARKSAGGRAPSPSVEETPIYISRCASKSGQGMAPRRAPPVPASGDLESTLKCPLEAAQSVSIKRDKEDPQCFGGKRAAKKFASPEGFSVFYGTVAKDDRYDSDEECRVWCVNYDDGDEEEYNEKELTELFELYEMEKDGDRKK
jgi:hypothetical protein